MAVPEGVKKPQDRKSKDEPAYKPGDLFTFEHDGETYTLANPSEAITPGFIRKNRNAGGMDLTFGALEILADADQLEVIDGMSWAQNRELLQRFDAYIGAFFEVSMGE